MNSSCEQTIRHHLAQSRDSLARAANDQTFIDSICAGAALIETCFSQGGKLLIAGNGGSAADSQHIAAELVGRYRRDRRAMPAIALTTDTSVLTSIGNDYGFDQIFVRQLRALSRPGDVFLALSTSGRSPNVLAALAAARDAGVGTMGFTGEAAESFTPLCDIVVAAPSSDTAVIQQLHLTAAHAICDYLEQGIPDAAR
jgi:D-sedoheptulose 7-phosphate isomerase